MKLFKRTKIDSNLSVIDKAIMATSAINSRNFTEFASWLSSIEADGEYTIYEELFEQATGIFTHEQMCGIDYLLANTYIWR